MTRTSPQIQGLTDFEPGGSRGSPPRGGEYLPAALSAFVGRRRERSDLSRLLGTARLVTLCGSPGVGKTRLAAEVAADATSGRPDGVWLVELASVMHPALLPQVVATELAVRERPGSELIDTLVDELRHRRILIILDNCEHLVDACARLAERLLRSCPLLTVMATSREPLGLTGEWVRRIEPLSVPAGGERTYDSVIAHDSVRLFVDRGAAIRADFALSPANARIVADICLRLDGLPLAIELAAARLELLSPAEILDQLDERFRVLRSTGTAVPASHGSLLAALDWSHHLLSDPEATLFRRISVFAGGCTLEAAEVVGAAGDVRRERVIDLLGALVRKSLVHADTGEAETRYGLLDSVRHYAADRLREAEEEAAVCAAHCDWSVTLAERAELQLASGTQVGWLRRLENEQDNFRTAFEWAMAAGRTDAPLRLGGSLAPFWWLHGHVGEGMQLLDRALDAGREASPQLRAKALWCAAFLMGSVGHVGRALPLAEQSAALAEECGDGATGDRARNLVGLLSMYRSPVDSLPLLEENLKRARSTGDRPLLSASLCNLASALLLVGDPAAARAHLDECLELAGQAGNRSLVAEVLGLLGQAALAAGDYPGAEDYLGRALGMARELGERGEEAVVLSWLGELSRSGGDFEQAKMLLDHALALARDVGRPFLVARCLCFLGRVALAEASVTDARACFVESLAMSRTLELSYLSARCLLGLGHLSLIDDDLTGARTWFDLAVLVAQTNGDRQAMAESSLALAEVARRCGPLEQARSLCHEALTLQKVIGDLPGIAASLEKVAALAGDSPDAARLFGAAQALRDERGYARAPAASAGYERDLMDVRGALGGDAFAAAWSEGLALSAAEAVNYATRRRGPRRRPPSGWASLTPAEHDVARLAGEGLTNRQIGERLFVSPRTVGAHLAHVFAKLGISSRKELIPPGQGVVTAGD